MLDRSNVNPTDEQTARVRDEALRRALNTPPQPKPSQNPKPVKPDAEKASAGKRGRPAGAS